MATFEEFWDVLKGELADFAEESWQQYKDAAVKDGSSFLDKSKADLERWTQSLAAGALTRDDLDWLMRGKKDLAELVTLKERGLAQVALDKFVSGLIDTVVGTAIKVFV